MKELVMISWKTGTQVVSLIEAVKEYSTGSLIKAKADVERLLSGHPVTLRFATETAMEEFRWKAEGFGVVFE